MKVLALLFSLFTAPTGCDENYSVIYVPAELNSAEGMQALLERMESVAKSYCTEHLPVSSYPVLQLCRSEVVSELAREVDHAIFRDFVRQAQHDQLVHKRPILM